MKEICVVAPIFNEESNILEFLKSVIQVLSEISQEFEIIIVDDGSTDKSWEILKLEAAKNPLIKIIKFSKNFGHHYAITAGLHSSNAKWTVVMDSDLQDRPEVIGELYRKVQEGYDVVFVSRQNRQESNLYLLIQKLFYIVLNLLSGMKFNSNYANFSIISRKVVLAYENFPENTRFYSSTIKWLGFKTGEIEADHGLRHGGRPAYTLKKRFKLAADVILAFSDRPLKLAIFFGLNMASVAVIMTMWISWRAIKSEFVIMGWPSLMAAIFFVGGSILVMLGIMGIYLGKIFLEVKKRPLYIIDEYIN
jgi:glycosyltransferase involved in cell wall biosynthesis